jgi:hypothetical protein
MRNFRIQIASAPDREKLVAEIWYAEIFVAEINQEKTQNLEIEFYPGDKVTFDLNEFIETLESAKRELIKG